MRPEILRGVRLGVALLTLAAAAGFGGCAATHRDIVPAAGDTVMIDPGHGGHDRGGISRRHLSEKTLNLDTARRLGAELERRGRRVVYTRSSDRFVSLAARCALANRLRPKVFVSVHYDATRRRSASGVETYYYRRSDRTLALRVQRALVRATGAADRGLSRRRFYVLRNTRRPAILVECGFLTHRREAARCGSASYRQKIAAALADGILGPEGR